MGYFDVQSSGLNNGSITVTGTWYEGGEARGNTFFHGECDLKFVQS